MGQGQAREQNREANPCLNGRLEQSALAGKPERLLWRLRTERLRKRRCSGMRGRELPPVEAHRLEGLES